MIISNFPEHQLAKLSKIYLADIYYKNEAYSKALELLNSLLDGTGSLKDEAVLMINNIHKDMK